MELDPCKKCGWDICICDDQGAPGGALPKDGRGPKSKHWCFTINNYTCILTEMPPIPDLVYVVYQEEIGEKGTPHLQGYLQFSAQKRGAWVTNQVEALHLRKGKPHTEAARGSDEDNEAYCTKEDGRLGGPYRFGERQAIAGKKGGRSDLIAVKRDLDNGMSMRDVSKKHFGDFIRYARGLKEYKRLNTAPRDGPPEVVVYCGPSGTGKSMAALAENPGAYWFPPGGNWWDDYDGEHTVIVDEMYGHRLPFTFLLQLLDRYPLKVQTKGGFVEMTAKKFVFTTNQEPEDWYDGEKTHQASWAENPLNRRLTEFGRIVRTGDVHRRVRPRLVAPEDADFGIPQ